ncbi:MAG: DUF1871 family protein [Clostridia bacterium]|nr:DUF1871 family protein [Clostridia bacterium]
MSEYTRKLAAIKAAIDEWNPYDLLPHAPTDEFESEAALCAAKIQPTDPVETVAQVVSDVFSKAFDDPQGFSVQNCMPVANTIIKNLTA